MLKTERIIIASGPVIVENGKVLLVKHDDNFFKFCGGKVKKNETLFHTAIRESKEELGIKIEITNKSPFIIHTKKFIDHNPVDVILVHYLAKRLTKTIKPSKTIKEWTWIDITKIKKNYLAPNIIPALKHFKFLK